jgi:hypothetical protein
LQVITKDRWVPDAVRDFRPKTDLGRYVKNCLVHLPGEMAAELIERITRTVVIESALFVAHLRDGLMLRDYGLVSQKVVTTAGAAFIAARMAGTSASNIANFNFHGIGTGGTAESSGDTALVTELTTQYNPDNTRATGTQSTPGSTNIYQTVGTNTVDSGVAITEHGIFSQAATGGGTLLDRSLFSVVNLANGDSLQTTYQFTITAGG